MFTNNLDALLISFRAVSSSFKRAAKMLTARLIIGSLAWVVLSMIGLGAPMYISKGNLRLKQLKVISASLGL